MSSAKDQTLRSMLAQLSADLPLNVSETSENNEVDNIIAEENTNSKKRSQEFLLTEMEQKLEIAEINFGTLKQQLEYMKMLYHDIHKDSDKPDKQKKDRPRKKSQNKAKNTSFSRGLSVKRRFSSASVYKAKNSVSENLKSIGSRVVTYSTTASNTEVSAIVESEGEKNKPSESEEIAPPETPNRETKSLQELNPESAKEQQSMNLSQMLCNQEQQTDPLQISNTHEVKEEFWYGFPDEANQKLEHCGLMTEQFTASNTEKENELAVLRHDPIGQELQCAILISGNSRTSFSSSRKASGKTDESHNLLYLESPKNGSIKSKAKSKKSVSQSTILTNSLAEYIDTVNKHKRKPKFHGRNTEKKRKNAISKTNIQPKQIKPIVTETMISVTTRTSKKNSKIKLHSSKSTTYTKKTKKGPSEIKISLDPKTFSIQKSFNEVPVPVRPSKNLVELYHNEKINVNISEENVPESKRAALSAEKNSNTTPKSSRKSKVTKKQLKCLEDEKECNDLLISHNETAQPKASQPVEIPFTPAHAAPNQEEKKELNKNEQLKTTISSDTFVQPAAPTKFRYFKKNYYKRFNFRKIPFVAGTSTSPSHNLGLNIQQVLSMIKTKQPYVKESLTTDTHIVEDSAFIQHTVHGRSACPASINYMLTRKEVLTKENPDDSKADDSSTLTTNGIFFGLTNKEKRPEDIWCVDQDDALNKKPKCMCIPSRRCVDYQQLLIEYLEKGGGDISFLSRKYSAESYPHFPPPERQVHSHFSTVSKGLSQDISAVVSNPWKVKQSTINGTSKNGNIVRLPAQAYKIKAVLTHLHDDFNRLNTQYEQLQNGFMETSLSKEKKLEMEKLQAELYSKEEEINMIKDLYKEVSALKQHMKALQIDKNHPHLSVNNSTMPYFGKGPTPSVRLTKLLRIIQQFQYRLRQVNARNAKSFCFYHCYMINFQQ